MIHSNSTTNKSKEYEKLMLDLEVYSNKMKTALKHVENTIQTEESLLHTMNKNYQSRLEELDEKKKKLQDTIAQQKRNIAEVEQKLPHTKDIALANRVIKEQEETNKLMKTRQALLTKRNELNQKILEKQQEEANKVSIEKRNRLLNELELNAYRHALQLEIINRYDAIKFEFKCVDKKAPEKTYSLALTINESNSYTVIECHPDSVLPEISKLLIALNEDRELFVFIKGVRRIFQDSARS
ncbi:hypothetical protein [Parasitella parasitica]|uniref:Kinetochore protein SPC25 n=1 Tax=Parasitella parasitica TaxID=35722 RepID=A0A0B7NIJ0_9FUNG|nr:hypothetical protein [Parasitella parasitica]